MQSKETDAESEEEGFLGARYAAARHIVPDRACDAAPPRLPYLSHSIPNLLDPYPHRLNAARFEVDQIMRGEAAGGVRIFWITCSSCMLAHDRLY